MTKVKQFKKKLLYLKDFVKINMDKILIDIYYKIDKDGNRIYDIDSIRKDFDTKLQNLGTKENFYVRWRKNNLNE